MSYSNKVFVIGAIIGLIFIAASPSTYSQLSYKQGIEKEQEYINAKSYQGCKPETIDSTEHVLTWSCPPGTETLQERLFTANKTTNEICYETKYNNTKAYAQLCK